jgi:hypothetical protein
LRELPVTQRGDVNNPAGAIRSASALTEVTFLRAGQTLEASSGILAELTSRFATVLEELEGEKPGQALQALLGISARVTSLGQNRLQENAKFARIRSLTEAIGGRIAQLKVSLKHVDSLAVNAKIAAADIRVPGTDFIRFADEIGRTLKQARTTLDQFDNELRIVRQHVAVAQTGQQTFDLRQQEAANSITERLSATVQSIAQQHERAARAGLEVRLGSARVRQRICDAILALQIGDITRQRLEHTDAVLEELSGTRALDADTQRLYARLARGLQSAQLVDAAGDFDQDVRQVIGSLNSLAAEARGLRTLGDDAYGAVGRIGSSFIAQLEGQISEALGLFESFETAQAEVANVTATVSDATAGLSAHLRTVQWLEADIRIMGLNTTFKCARIGREGLALSVIAQELRDFANGFAKEAGALMQEVETVAGISNMLTGATDEDQGAITSEGTRGMRDALVTLRQMGQMLDRAIKELEVDSDRVVTLLVETVSNLAVQGEIGQVLRDAAEQLAESSPVGGVDFAELPAPIVQRLALIERAYTMSNERSVHDRFLGRPVSAEPVAETASGSAMEDFLF